MKESYTNHVVILHGETQIATLTYIPTEGKISSLKLFAEGKNVLYVMEKKSVSYSNKLMLFDVKSGTQLAIMESSLHPIEFVILNINNKDVIICRETTNSLKVRDNLSHDCRIRIIQRTDVEDCDWYFLGVAKSQSVVHGG